jgi:hypothetical protein
MGVVGSWQYTGAEEVVAVLAWCRQHIPDQFIYHGFETIYFTDSASFTAFTLRWGH